jgi:hypothetical protein
MAAAHAHTRRPACEHGTRQAHGIAERTQFWSAETWDFPPREGVLPRPLARPWPCHGRPPGVLMLVPIGTPCERNPPLNRPEK